MKAKTLKPTSTTIKLASGIVLLVALLTFAVVRAEQSKKADALAATQAKQAQVAKDVATQQQIQTLQAQNKAETAKRVAVCQYVQKLSTTGTTRFYVTVPVVSCQ